MTPCQGALGCERGKEVTCPSAGSPPARRLQTGSLPLRTATSEPTLRAPLASLKDTGHVMWPTPNSD